MRHRGALDLYATRLRQLVLGPPGELPAPCGPDLPPGRTVLLPGRGEVFVRDMDGPPDRLPVLLLHGWLVSAELNWFGTFPAFAGQRRVVGIDHRGHGRGMRCADVFRLEDCADDAAALLDVLGIEQAIVAGFSMGGPIAMLLAARHPERVAGLVPSATALVFSETWIERLRWRLLRILEFGARFGIGDRLVPRLAVEWGEADERLAAYSGWVSGEFSRLHPPSMRQAGRALADFDARGWAGGLGLPAAVVLTGDDSLVPVRRQRRLAEVLDAAEIVLPDADHDVPITDIDSFAHAIHRAVSVVDEALVDEAPAAPDG